MTITRRIAEFIVSSRLDRIPVRAREAAKTAMIDCLGVTLAGSREPCARILTRLLEEAGGRPEATVIGTGLRVAATEAALANGTAGHALDYDDWHGRTGHFLGHASVALLPAILALGEKTGASGIQALEAYAVGFEVGAKIGVALTPAHYVRGFHATGTLGVLRAATASAKILGLDVERTCHALGIAASQGSGLRVNFGTMTKPFHAGHAARAGVLSARLAREGFSASPDVLDGPLGLFAVFGEELDRGRAVVLEDLGEPWELETPGVNLKKYPSCGGTHTAIDLMLELVDQGVSADAIEAIHCHVAEVVRRILVHARPRTGLEGKFSMEYCLAAAVVDGEVTLRQFDDAMVQRSGVQRLMPRIRIDAHPGVTGDTKDLLSELTVTLADGRRLSRRASAPRGDASQPLTSREVRDKYEHCAGLVLEPERVRRSFELVESLEHVQDVGELTRALRPGEGA
jgi:2-methylcitrate dehydratase PrpD